MAAERFTFDTNILFYAIDPGDPEKHARAKQLLQAADTERVSLLLQTLGEVCNAVTRRKEHLRSETNRMVQLLALLFPVSPSSFEDINDALTAHDRHHLQFWDAVLWATARRTGCTTVLTEDLQDGQTLGGVTFRNPFRMTAAEFESYLN